MPSSRLTLALVGDDGRGARAVIECGRAEISFEGSAGCGRQQVREFVELVASLCAHREAVRAAGATPEKLVQSLSSVTQVCPHASSRSSD